MLNTRLSSPLAFVLAAAFAAAFSPATAAAQTKYFDVNDLSDAVPVVESPTQTDWTAVNLNNINNVTFTPFGDLFLDDRDRGAGENSTGTFDDMWRDFIFADQRETNFSLPAGMDITIGNLAPNQLFSVSLWAFDVVSRDPRRMTWNGVAYEFNGNDALPGGLMEKRVTFNTMSNAAGIATLEGRINRDGGFDDCCNVFVNGFSVTAVPEPASMALVGFGMVGIAVVGRRRRRALTE